MQYNLIHDIQGAVGHPGSGAAGFYTDCENSNWIIHHNIFWNIAGCSIQINNRQNYNMIFNNDVWNSSASFSSAFAGFSNSTIATGSSIVNNLLMNAPEGEWGDTDLRYNLWTGIGYVNPGTDFSLQSTSPARDQGLVVPGITNGYVGSAPDIGALEYGGTNWTSSVGYNITPPSPDPTYIFPSFVFANKANGSFESGTFSNWTTAGDAVWVRLEVPAALIGVEGKTLNGMAFDLYGGGVTWDRAGKKNGSETVWVEDAVPTGASTVSYGGDSWNWVSSNPTPYSGSSAHQSNISAGMHYHYFYNATSTLQVNAGDTLFAYAYVDPDNMPSEIMLEWGDGANWYAAYWGANIMNNGTRTYMGPIPTGPQLHNADAWFNGTARSGFYSVDFEPGTSEIYQTVTGLQPDQWYRLYVPVSGKDTALTSAAVTFGVRNYGGATVQMSAAIGDSEQPIVDPAAWKTSWLNFKTGPTSTTADIYVDVTSTATVGDGIYVDDIGVELRSGGGIGLRGQYFNNEDFTNLALTRDDPTIDFRSWGTGSPDPSLIAGTYSVRWTGQVTPLYSETYTFYTSADDGARLWVNGQLVSDHWSAAGEFASTMIALTAGQKYDIKLDYHQHSGAAGAVLKWSSTSQALEVIPASQLYPGPDFVWIDDAVPTGATTNSAGGDSWTWVSGSPTPLNGSLAHQSNILAGTHYHEFSGATQTMVVNAGDMLYAYVYLDPSNMPSEVMLNWREGTSWAHGAYWGANILTYGTDGTASRRYMGALPASGSWVRLEVPAGLVGLEGMAVNGMSFILYNGRATWDIAGKTVSSISPDFDWVDDAVPLGATTASYGGDNWNSWVSSSPTPFSGSVAHQSAIVAGTHYHYFYNATQTMPVNSGDTLYAYVYLDPSNMPTEVMIEWREGTSWEHRAYWGSNILGYGTDGTASRRYMGALPAGGGWVRLEVPAGFVGLNGTTVNGMNFMLYGGHATWDRTGKTASPDLDWVDDAVPTGATTASYGGDSWNWVSSTPTPYSGSLVHQSAIVAGAHYHYFYDATQTMRVNTGDTLYAYVYLDPNNMPSEVLIEWREGASWEHRAYWGANTLAYGTNGTASRYYMGALPAGGSWVRLEVPAALVGLEDTMVNGMDFVLCDGRATWDRAGRMASLDSVWIDDSVPTGATLHSNGGG